MMETAMAADDVIDTLPVIARLVVDAAAMVALLTAGFLRRRGRPDRVLTLVTCNVVVFLITYLLSHVELSMGAAFGVFAVFSLLRFRTEGISARDMTYLFLSIALGLLSATARGDMGELALLAAVPVLSVLALESRWLAPRERAHPLVYDDVRLLGDEHRAALLADLSARTSLDVRRVDVESIDLLKQCALLTIYHVPRAPRTGA